MKNCLPINTIRIIESKRRKSGQVNNPVKIRKVNKTPESSNNNRTHQNIRDMHSQTLQNSTISFDRTSTSIHRLFKNKEEFNNYMFYKKYYNSRKQYQKIITQLSDIENRIKENNEKINKMKKYLIKLKLNKKQKQTDIVNLLSNKESLEEIYKSKMSHLKNKPQIYDINKPNVNDAKNNEKKDKNENNEKNVNNEEKENEQNNEQSDNNSNDNENNNINNDLCTQNSTINLFEENNYDVSIEEIRLSDKKKYEEQVIMLAEEILHKKNTELRNKLKEKIYLAYHIFSSEYNSESSIDQNNIIYNFFARISLFISNQSLGNYSEQFINSFLRHLIKINYIGVEISQILKFLNKKYKDIKLEVKEKMSNLIKRNENYKNKKISYETKRDELIKFIQENKDISKSYDRTRKRLDEDNRSNSYHFSFISDNNVSKEKTFRIKSNDKSDRTKIPILKNLNKNQIKILRDDINNQMINNKTEKVVRKSADNYNKTYNSRRMALGNENNENKNQSKIYKIKKIRQITSNLNFENIHVNKININEKEKKNINLISNKLNTKLNMNRILNINNYKINTWNNGYNGKDTKKDAINVNKIDNIENINMSNKQIINVNNLLINNNINIENNNIINNSNNKLKNGTINTFYSNKTLVHNNKKNNNTYYSDNRKNQTHRKIKITPNNNYRNNSKKNLITDNINDNVINGLVRNRFNNSNISEVKYNNINKKIINSRLNNIKNKGNNNKNNFRDKLKIDIKYQNSKSFIMLNDSKNFSQKNINNKSMNILNSPIKKLKNPKIIIIPREKIKSEIINNKNNKVTYNSKTLVNGIKSPKLEYKSSLNKSPTNINNTKESSKLRLNFINKNNSYNSNTYINRKDELKNRRIDISIIDKNNIYSKRFDNRLQALIQDIKDSFCYYKISDKDNFNFDPLDNCSSTPESFGYIDGYISIDILNHKLKISPKHSKDKNILFDNNNTSLSESNYNEEENEGIQNYINVELKDILDIVFTKNMKNIIRIYNAYGKYSAGKENINVNRFIYSRELNDIPMEQNERIKAAFCNYFIFTLIMGEKSISKIEFIFINYEHFNLWLNCFQYISKFNIQHQNATIISSRIYNTNTNISPNRNKK